MSDAVAIELLNCVQLGARLTDQNHFVARLSGACLAAAPLHNLTLYTLGLCSLETKEEEEVWEEGKSIFILGLMSHY